MPKMPASHIMWGAHMLSHKGRYHSAMWSAHSLSLDGRKGCRALEKRIAKKKLTETLIQLTTPSLSSHFKWCFLLLMEGFPSRQCLGHVFAITQLICSNVTHFEKKPLDHMKPQLNTEGNRLSFHPYRFVRHDAWPPCALGVFSKEVQNQKQDIEN